MISNALKENSLGGCIGVNTSLPEVADKVNDLNATKSLVNMIPGGSFSLVDYINRLQRTHELLGLIKNAFSNQAVLGILYNTCEALSKNGCTLLKGGHIASDETEHFYLLVHQLIAKSAAKLLGNLNEIQQEYQVFDEALENYLEMVNKRTAALIHGQRASQRYEELLTILLKKASFQAYLQKNEQCFDFEESFAILIENINTEKERLMQEIGSLLKDIKALEEECTLIEEIKNEKGSLQQEINPQMQYAFIGEKAPYCKEITSFFETIIRILGDTIGCHNMASLSMAGNE
jgi:hypothetical protein